jgi:hypothetical protein
LINFSRLPLSIIVHLKETFHGTENSKLTPSDLVNEVVLDKI